LSAGAAVAAERTVTLDIENVGCATCAPILKRTLSRMPGVSRVVIAERAGSATTTVTFDDARVTPNALFVTTTNAGFPSRAREN
jgi:periplasmic mercuric ion binding protein